MNARRVAVLNMNQTRRDPRVLRISTTLRDAGHDAQVFELNVNGQAEREVVQNIPVARAALPADYSLDAMAAIGEM